MSTDQDYATNLENLDIIIKGCKRSFNLAADVVYVDGHRVTGLISQSNASVVFDMKLAQQQLLTQMQLTHPLSHIKNMWDHIVTLQNFIELTEVYMGIGVTYVNNPNPTIHYMDKYVMSLTMLSDALRFSERGKSKVPVPKSTIINNFNVILEGCQEGCELSQARLGKPLVVSGLDVSITCDLSQVYHLLLISTGAAVTKSAATGKAKILKFVADMETMLATINGYAWITYEHPANPQFVCHTNSNGRIAVNMQELCNYLL